jgi:capsular polysaccharide biosynthesis protein
MKGDTKRMEQEYQEIDLKELFVIIIKKWWLIILLCGICAGAAYYITDEYVEPVYKAQTSLFLGKEEGEIAGIDISLQELQAYNQLITDYRALAGTRLILEQVIDELGLQMEASTLEENLTIESIDDSRLFTISFEHTNQELAADVANAVAEQLKNKATEIIQVQNIMIIDEALVPENPISPNKKMNTAIAGVLGIMLALFIIMLLHFLDNTIKDENDIEKQLGLTVIGVIPVFKGEGR